MFLLYFVVHFHRFIIDRIYNKGDNDRYHSAQHFREKYKGADCWYGEQNGDLFYS
jgi:hypothetical protein